MRRRLFRSEGRGYGAARVAVYAKVRKRIVLPRREELAKTSEDAEEFPELEDFDKQCRQSKPEYHPVCRGWYSANRVDGAQHPSVIILSGQLKVMLKRC